MAILPISKVDFDSRNPARSETVALFATEKSWFADTDRNLIGTVLHDHSDRDWNYVILALHEDQSFRCVATNTCLETQDLAETELVRSMNLLDETGEAREILFRSDDDQSDADDRKLAFTNINDEVKKYFQKYPEKLYDMPPRKFEELIASIMEDLGFDVELTKATRDGGRDIIIHIKNTVCNLLAYIECKRHSPDNKVGVGIIREVAGVHYIRKPSKSIIVTTSFFTPDAQKEASEIEHQLELKDYEDIKDWLAKY